MSLIEFKKVSYQVGDKKILNQIDLTVTDDDYLTIVGLSGSGKSTILTLMAQMISATAGEIIFDGQNIAGLDPIKYRRMVSYCVQQPALFGETVEDNLKFPAEIRGEAFNRKRALELMARVQLPESMMAQKVTEVSGGERQRIALLRNLMYLPKVLLLDEITTGLDAENKAIVWDLIRSIHREEQIAIVSVTHDQQEIENAGKVITVVDGRIKQ